MTDVFLVSYSALLFIKKLTIVSIFVSKVLSHPKFLREGISVGSGRRISIARMSDREIGLPTHSNTFIALSVVSYLLSFMM